MKINQGFCFVKEYNEMRGGSESQNFVQESDQECSMIFKIASGGILRNKQKKIIGSMH